MVTGINYSSGALAVSPPVQIPDPVSQKTADNDASCTSGSLVSCDTFLPNSSSETKQDAISYLGSFIERTEASKDPWVINSQDFQDIKNAYTAALGRLEEKNYSEGTRTKLNKILEEQYVSTAQKLDMSAQKEQAAISAYSALTGGASDKDTREALELDPWRAHTQTETEELPVSQKKLEQRMREEQQKNSQILEQALNNDVKAQQLVDRHRNLIASTANLARLDTNTTVVPAEAEKLNREQETAIALVNHQIQEQTKKYNKLIEETNKRIAETDDPEQISLLEQKLNELREAMDEEKCSEHKQALIDEYDKYLKTLSKEEQDQWVKNSKTGKYTDEQASFMTTKDEDVDKTRSIYKANLWDNPADYARTHNGLSKFDYYEQNRERLDLDRVLRKGTIERIRTESYSSSSRYYAKSEDKDESSRARGKSESTGSAAAPTLINAGHDLAVSMGLANDLSRAQIEIAKRHNLDPTTQMTLITLLSIGDQEASLKYARDHGMAALEASILNMQASQTTKAPPPASKQRDGWDAFALNEADPFLERPLKAVQGPSLDNFFGVSIS